MRSQFPAVGKDEPLTIRAILPGLAFILLLDAVTVAGWLPRLPVVARVWPWVMAVLPWTTLLVVRGAPAALGYRRRRALAEYGWGMVAGGAWRVLSLAFNLALASGGDRLGWAASLVAGLIWAPLVEETFFRGYLGRAMVGRWGLWPGTLAQAVLFTLTPVHWSQGGLHLISIFGFGVLAGWLTQARRSLWSAWGAHGFANVLPLLLI